MATARVAIGATLTAVVWVTHGSSMMWGSESLEEGPDSLNSGFVRANLGFLRFGV